MDSPPLIIVCFYCVCFILITSCDARNIHLKVDSINFEQSELTRLKTIKNGYVSPYERYFPQWLSDIQLSNLNRVLRSTDGSSKRNIAKNSPIGRVRATTTAPQKLLRSLCEKPRGRFRHPFDCHKYLDCWDGRVIEQFCPRGTAYSDLPGGFCDYPEYVDCGGRSTTTTTTPSPPPPIGIIENDEPVDNTILPEQAELVGSQITAPGIVKLGSSSYIFVSTEKLTWRKAQQRCKSLGTSWDLLSIETEEENQLINTHISLIEFNSTNIIPYFTGGSNMGETKDKYYWTATQQDLSYTNWDENEPSAKYESKVGCIQMKRSLWSVVPCAVKRYYICEYYSTPLPLILKCKEVCSHILQESLRNLCRKSSFT